MRKGMIIQMAIIKIYKCKMALYIDYFYLFLSNIRYIRWIMMFEDNKVWKKSMMKLGFENKTCFFVMVTLPWIFRKKMDLLC